MVGTTPSRTAIWRRRAIEALIVIAGICALWGVPAVPASFIVDCDG